jgi:hypothetical protein
MRLLSLFLLLLIAPAISAAPRLDPPEVPGRKPYSPADHSRVAINPPPFIWQPVERDAVYAVQLSRNKDFTRPITFPDLPLSVFVPGKTLPAGDWFWRYGVKDKNGMTWGRARPFTIPGEARPFPFPDMKAARGRVPKTHPRLFFSGKRLRQVRAWAKGELKPEVDRLKRRCDRIIGQELVPEPAKPRSGPERVVVMRTTRPPMDDMERCGLAYLVSQERKYGEESKRRLLHFFSWDPDGPTGLWGYDEPAMWMMMRGIRAYDWTYDLFTPEERLRVEPVMKTRAAQFYKHLRHRRQFETNPYESHAGRMPGFLGEAGLCFVHEWPEAEPWIDYATLLYYTSYPAWGGDDGGWHEGPSYWGAYMRFALHYVVALKEATGIDLMRKPFFRNTPMYALYAATPYQQFQPFGDGQGRSPRGLGPLLYAFSTLAQNPYARWYAETSDCSPGGDILTLATYDPGLKARSPAELPDARCFPYVGLAATHSALGDRDKDIHLILRSSPLGSMSHGHADQNAFVIEAFGRGMAIATGYYPWYGSPHHHNWTRATRAVNSVLVNGEGQLRRKWEARGRIVHFETTETCDYIEAEAGEAYGARLEQFRRRILHVKPGVFVMVDDLFAREPSTFQWLLHTVNRIDIDGQTLTTVNNPGVLRVRLLAPENLDITQTDRYVPEPEVSPGREPNYPNTHHLTASTREPVRRIRFVCAFDVYRHDEQANLESAAMQERDDAVSIALTYSDGRRLKIKFCSKQTWEITK